jgi:ribosome biogenesis GTPase
LERLAALAQADGVPVALVLTKADLDPDADRTAARAARELGIADGVALSAVTGDGLAVLRSLLDPGRTAVLLGPSGAGKSTLVNALLGDGRGRHTTVTRELIALPGGALLLDTPGVREIGLWDGAGDSYADIDELAAGCRFSDCRHETEPGCAVRNAVDAERIDAWRKLAREQKSIDDRRAAARERQQSGRRGDR